MTKALVLGTIILLAVFTAPALAFTDVPGSHPNYEAINALSEWGVVDGFADGTFGPDDGVKRAQFAKMAAGMLNIQVTEGMTSPFTDLGSNDATLYPHEFVAAAYKHGITKGVTASTYNPWAYITRAQAITMSVRAMQNLYPGELDSTVYDFYSPWGQFSPDHWQNAAIANNNMLYQNLPDYEQLSPWDRMPREEVAQLLYNLQEYLPTKWMEAGWGETLRIMGPYLMTIDAPYVHPSTTEWADEGKQFLAVHLEAVNGGPSDWHLNVYDFEAVGSDGLVYTSPAYGSIENRLGVADVRPGGAYSAELAWELPTGVTIQTLRYDGGNDYDYTDYAWR